MKAFIILCILLGSINSFVGHTFQHFHPVNDNHMINVYFFNDYDFKVENRNHYLSVLHVNTNTFLEAGHLLNTEVKSGPYNHNKAQCFDFITDYQMKIFHIAHFHNYFEVNHGHTDKVKLEHRHAHTTQQFVLEPLSTHKSVYYRIYSVLTQRYLKVTTEHGHHYLVQGSAITDKNGDDIFMFLSC